MEKLDRNFEELSYSSHGPIAVYFANNRCLYSQIAISVIKMDYFVNKKEETSQSNFRILTWLRFIGVIVRDE